MRAWQVVSLGEPADALRLVDVPDLLPGPGQVSVRVLAAAANFPDVLMCRGHYQERPSLPFTPGIEVCGEVISVGPGVVGIEVGARVLGGAALPTGGFAETALMNESDVFVAPDVLDDAEAAAFYVSYQTGWFALHRRAALKAGETLLVHAAAGGVGSAAVQLGKAAGARVFGVVGSAEKVGVARALGADLVIDRTTEDVVEGVRTFTGGRGADVVFDPVGGDSYRQSTKCIAFEGRIVVVGFASGDIQSVALSHALVKNYSILGLHWGLYRSKDPASIRPCHAELSRMAGEGLLRPLVSERLSLEEVPRGLQALADGRTTGRVVYVA